MSLQYAILGVLDARSMSGYELTRMFESSARWVWSAPQSQIYPLLRKLEGEGLVQGEDQVRGEKMRRVQYSITEDGRHALREWLRSPMDTPTIRDPQLLQALFFDMIEPAEADDVLAHQIEDLRTLIAQWEAHRERLLAKDTPLLKERLSQRDPADHDRIAALKAHVFTHLIESARSRAEWAEQARRILASSGSPVTAHADRPAH
ncbi:PadR family transcriptional regulator [Microbacterium sp. RD1]|uniref:PadR family transcriptional regulator n=1 Tax=Microbacterium sp. RD1 TaxID=3457313 RepID=UPI003FA59450